MCKKKFCNSKTVKQKSLRFLITAPKLHHQLIYFYRFFHIKRVRHIPNHHTFRASDSFLIVPFKFCFSVVVHAAIVRTSNERTEKYLNIMYAIDGKLN